LSTPANKKMMEKALKSIDAGNIVKVDIENIVGK